MFFSGFSDGVDRGVHREAQQTGGFYGYGNNDWDGPWGNGTQLTLRDVPAYEPAQRGQRFRLEDWSDESESIHHSSCPADGWLACAICGPLWKRADTARSDFGRKSKRQILVGSA